MKSNVVAILPTLAPEQLDAAATRVGAASFSMRTSGELIAVSD
jgi:hypothetical protein